MIYILIIPAITLILTVYAIPIFHYSWLSLHSSSVLTGLEAIPNQGANWNRLFGDSRFWIDASQTIRFAASSVSIELLLALGIAILLNTNFRNRGVIRSLTLLPWALPTTLMALSWRWIFNTPYGPIEQINSIFSNNSLNVLTIPSLAWFATVIADVWKTTPFIALILLAGLQTIPKDIYEAFKLEGGNSIQSFCKLTLPLLEPYIIISLLFRSAQAFGVFDLIQVMTGGGPAGTTESLGLYAYLNAMRYLDFGYSATIMIASFVLLSTFCLIFWLIYKYLSKIINIAFS